MEKRKEEKRIIKLKKKYNPATAKYEPVLPLKKGKLRFKFRFNWKVILILILLALFLYALLSGWLNFGAVEGPPQGASGLIKP